VTDTTAVPAVDLRADLRARSTLGAFPHDVLRGARNVTDFFGAGFLGTNSALHVADAGIEDVVVVDTDEAKLDAMSAFYPGSWRFLPADAYLVARMFRETYHLHPPRIADVVIVDPWTQGIERAWRALTTWTQICRGTLLLGVHEPLFAGRGIMPRNAAAVDALIASFEFGARLPVVPTCRALHKRSDHAGGVWWAVLDVPAVV